MGMYDTVWFKDATGEDIGIQFKSGERICADYNVGDKIPIADGVHFEYDACFVVYHGKVVAAFDKGGLYNKWGGRVSYPNIDEENPILKMLKDYPPKPEPQ